jgi:DNA repair protein RadA/Sms
MTKPRTVFACSGCGAQAPKWLGRCLECGAWNTMIEESLGGGDSARRDGLAKPARGAAAREPARAIGDVRGDDVRRVPTGIAELDRCLGGGLVPGSLVLLGGEPGIGKSTLMLQAGQSLAARGTRVLYVSGEESPAQVKLRADRIGASSGDLHVLGEIDLDAILAEVERLKPSALVIDSVQVVHDQALSSAPGTVSQVKQAADRLLRLAKQSGIAVMLIGHVTKDGALAGPRTLEHLVDVVLQFESEAGHAHRLVRAAKNRFGPSGEVGVFEMRGCGLVEVPDASRLFLAERRRDTAGSVVFPSIEGTRPVLVEIQALVAPSPGPPFKRTCLGVDPARIAMLLAIADRSLDRAFAGCDVFVNVAGGLRLHETAADLPIVLALVSSAQDQPIPHDLVAFGEVGLGAEIRSVDRAGTRLKEARGHGFTRCLVARGNASPEEAPEGIEVLGADSLAAALRAVFGPPKAQSRSSEAEPRFPVDAHRRWPPSNRSDRE